MGFPCSLKATGHPSFNPLRQHETVVSSMILFSSFATRFTQHVNKWRILDFFLSLSLSFIFRCSFHFVILTQPLREGGCNEARLYIRGQIRAWRMRRFTWTVWNASMQECLDFSPPGNKGRARGCSDELRARGKRKRHGRFIHVNVPSAAMLDLFFTACSVTLNVMPRLSCIW